MRIEFESAFHAISGVLRLLVIMQLIAVGQPFNIFSCVHSSKLLHWAWHMK